MTSRQLRASVPCVLVLLFPGILRKLLSWFLVGVLLTSG